MNKLLPTLGILSAGAIAVAAGDLLPYQRKVTTQCALPPYPYARNSPTNPVSRETFSGVLLSAVVSDREASGVPAGATAPRFWQLRDSELRDRHCSLSQVTMWVQPDGEWRLSFTAEQNPLVGSDRQATPEARFLRNRFFVKVRAVGAERLATDVGVLPLAGPEMFCIEIPPFWLERGERRQVSYRGVLPAHDTRRLPYVDRLWIDLSWE